MTVENHGRRYKSSKAASKTISSTSRMTASITNKGGTSVHAGQAKGSQQRVNIRSCNSIYRGVRNLKRLKLLDSLGFDRSQSNCQPQILATAAIENQPAIDLSMSRSLYMQPFQPTLPALLAIAPEGQVQLSTVRPADSIREATSFNCLDRLTARLRIGGLQVNHQCRDRRGGDDQSWCPSSQHIDIPRSVANLHLGTQEDNRENT